METATHLKNPKKLKLESNLTRIFVEMCTSRPGHLFIEKQKLLTNHAYIRKIQLLHESTVLYLEILQL